MSEYQRYEFMTCDKPLTRAQLSEVNDLSSHIEATSTHALIEYNWGDFKYDPIEILHDYFDGFLYWANWGSPRLALRFPHGILPADLIDGYDLEEFVTFTPHPDYDILDIHFGDMESPDEWMDYELGSLIGIRDELMDGDLRALYIVWLAAQHMMGGSDEKENYEIYVPPVPPAFGKLTEAHQSLAELLQLPSEFLAAAARHSSTAAVPSADEDAAGLIKLLSPDRRDEYLARLAHNEPGLSRQLVRELRELNRDKTGVVAPTGEHVTYATLLTESRKLKAQRRHEEFERQVRLEQEEREQLREAHERRLQDIHDHRDTFWHQADKSATRGSAAGYDDAVDLLVEMRESAEKFQASQEFQERFRAWVQSHLRRPALLKRLLNQKFTLPDM